MDLFKVEVITKTANPQQVIYAAMHQDYSDRMVNPQELPEEVACGDIIVNRLLKGGRGHYGPLEHPQITFVCGYFPHSVIQQARTHRVGVSFDVQSMRYTSKQFIEAAEEIRDIEEVFYLRSVGYYADRQGGKYYYSPALRSQHINWCKSALHRYKEAIDGGMPEEQARGIIPFDYRQHFVVSFNARSLLHFLDLRHKKDAQIEIQKLCDLLWGHFQDWIPAIASWYKQERLNKAKLAP